MRACVILMALALVGCDQKTWSRGEIMVIAQDEQRDLQAEVEELRSELEQVKSDLAQIEGETKLNTSIASSVSEQVSKNARIANENAAKDMTRVGACGQEWFQQSDGIAGWRNKRCTVADLKE